MTTIEKLLQWLDTVENAPCTSSELLEELSAMDIEFLKERQKGQELADKVDRLIAACVHMGRVMRSLSERGAYPKELLPNNPAYLGKQGYMWFVDAVRAITGWYYTEWNKQVET